MAVAGERFADDVESAEAVVYVADLGLTAGTRQSQRVPMVRQ
jgi:hypothetical protein